jgi:prepilin-type N-terminal cleavage/methylation domain-containing protein
MKKNCQKGFTLIEIIAVLLLVGTLAAAILTSLVPVIQGLAQVQTNTETAQKARLAMARMERELTTITEIVSSGGASITYRFLFPVSMDAYTIITRTLEWNGPGNPVRLDGVPLVDSLLNFEINHEPGPPHAIDLTLVMNNSVGADTFTTRVVPRNILNGVLP